ncbi:MAG: signal peptidase II [Patescibacteria group bacterium]
MNKILTKRLFTNIAIITVIAMFFIADRYLKGLALRTGINNGKSLFNQYFLFNFTENHNIAFSLPLSGPILNIIIISLIIAIIFIIGQLIIKNRALTQDSLILTFILFGAISNIVDRLQYGFVIDYLELKYFTVFNLADVMISLGVLTLIFKLTKSKKIC